MIPMPTMNNRDLEGKPTGVYQPRVFGSTGVLITTLFFFVKKIQWQIMPFSFES